MPHCSLISMGTPLFYFKIEVIIWQIFSGQSLNKNLSSLLFQRNYLNDWSLGERWNFVSLESQCFPRLRLRKHWNSGKQNSLFPLGPVISVKCNTVAGVTRWRETTLQLILVACPWETSRDATCIFQSMGCQRRFGDMPREIIFLGARKCCFPCFPINSFRGKNAEYLVSYVLCISPETV